MKQELDYSEFIERYLKGEMAPEEKIWFEKEIEGNQLLKNDIRLWNKVDNVLSNKELILLKAQLNQIHEEIYHATEKGKGAIRKIYQRVYYSAGVLVVAVLMFALYLTNRNFTNEKLVELYYQPEVGSVTYRSAEGVQDKMSQAMELYNSKEYKLAIDIFEQILAEDNNKPGVNLYSGIAHMELNKYGIASDRFLNVLSNKPNPFVESAQWYLGMCYLIVDNRAAAEKYFKELAYNDSYYSKNAKKILRRIN